MNRPQPPSSIELNPLTGHHEPTSSEGAEYPIRAPANHLQEDPDVEEGIVYRVTPGAKVTDEQLEICAKHYSQYYAVWSNDAWKFGMQPGQHIQASASDMTVGLFHEQANNILITAITSTNRQVGHCFVLQWNGRAGERVWWITQSLVLPSYRNQRRATKMLQALVLHYNIGKVSNQKDFVGSLTPNPYTLSAVLRVFGHGIESLPSKPDWESNALAYPNAPLPVRTCAPILASSPFEILRRPTMDFRTLTMRTDLYADLTESKRARQRIVFAMNKLVDEPWEWLFGHLANGHEYLCVLGFTYTVGDQHRRQFSPQQQVRSDSLGGELAGPKKAPARYRRPGLREQPAIDYTAINTYLLCSPQACRLEQQSKWHARMQLPLPEIQPHLGTAIRQAKALLLDRRTDVEEIMGAKQIPEGVRSAFAAQGNAIPEHLRTWNDVAHTDWLLEYDGGVPESAMRNRFSILQAVHFNELTADVRRRRKLAAR
ncbi:hypothetical protein IQ07DRAFT_648562 [Pyrenochaeta sp. DS3sAY3a]|nr:hypothetical protein IQ07DRAFT_648562 [Pyrenochaeta sp. DS3sAY3a]